jgi:coupling of ubiquitin conjugation to ER degradation protein 1
LGTSSSVAGSSKQPNLISRYRLETRLSDDSAVGDKPEEAGGKAAWEATAEKREASLQERKAKMVLAARK